MFPRSLCLAFGLMLLASTASAQKTKRPDLRVQVELKNGSALIGVAQHGRLVERLHRGGYVATEQKSSRRAGIRVWYFRNQRGFIFVPYRNISKVTELGVLTADDTVALKAAVRQAEQSRKVAKPLVPVKSVDPKSDKPDDAPTPLSEEERRLLEEFPPSKGWSAERFGEIQRKKIVLKRQPTVGEKKFVKNFEAWDRAQKKRQARADARATDN